MLWLTLGSQLTSCALTNTIIINLGKNQLVAEILGDNYDIVSKETKKKQLYNKETWHIPTYYHTQR